MRSRAAILPFPGDPFLLHYWLRQFDNVWQDEVDALYIYHNSTAESEVRNYIAEECKKRPKVFFMESLVQKEHGQIILEALEACEQTHIVLLEDDCFIFRKGLIDAAFETIESNKKLIIGSKRGSCSMEILNRAQKIWGLNYEGEGDQGCNFWPNLFFTTKDVLIKTDRNFGAKAWHQNQEIFYLSRPNDPFFIQDTVAYGDTFVNTSLQLRHTYPENAFHYIPQYHGSPDDLDHFYQKKGIFDGYAPWVHIGSLSSGVGGVLRDDQNRALIRRQTDEPKGTTILEPWANTEGEKREWERRVQWWLTFYEHRDSDKIQQFAEYYKIAIDRVIQQYGLSIKSIRARQEAYRTLGLP